MSTPKSGSEPAFPHDGGVGSVGLSKREYLAGSAMQGLISGDFRDSLSAQQIAERAAECATALLAELAKEDAK